MDTLKPIPTDKLVEIEAMYSCDGNGYEAELDRWYDLGYVLPVYYWAELDAEWVAYYGEDEDAIQ